MFNLSDTENYIQSFFELKHKYTNSKSRRIIFGDHKLSQSEKRLKYVNGLKCIICRQPGGSIFETKYNKKDKSRHLIAKCASNSKKCTFNIDIRLGNTHYLTDYIQEFELAFSNLKSEIIRDKNRLMFGLGDEQNLLTKFTHYQTKIIEIETTLRDYQKQYKIVVENRKNQKLMQKNQAEMNALLESVSNGSENISELPELFATKLIQLMQNIRTNTYSEIYVHANPDTNINTLIQHVFTIKDLEIYETPDKILAYKVTKNTTTRKLKPTKTSASKTLKRTKRVKDAKNKIPKTKIVVPGIEEEEKEEKDEEEEEEEDYDDSASDSSEIIDQDVLIINNSTKVDLSDADDITNLDYILEPNTETVRTEIISPIQTPQLNRVDTQVSSDEVAKSIQNEEIKSYFLGLSTADKLKISHLSEQERINFLDAHKKASEEVAKASTTDILQIQPNLINADNATKKSEDTGEVKQINIETDMAINF